MYHSLIQKMDFKGHKSLPFVVYFKYSLYIQLASETTRLFSGCYIIKEHYGVLHCMITCISSEMVWI